MIRFGMENKNDLFLERLIDGPNNELVIYTCTAREKSPSEEEVISKANKQLRDIIAKCTEIVPDYTKLYKVHFSNYIMYQVRNESYASYDPSEIRLGKGLVLFEKSRLLDSLGIWCDTYLANYRHYNYRHYGVYALNHIVDIISHVEPAIDKADPKNMISQQKQHNPI